MKITFTSLLIFILIVLVSYLIYNYYISYSLPTEGFQTTQGNVTTKTISHYSDSKALINIKDDVTYFDTETGNVVIDLNSKVTVYKPTVVPFNGNVQENLYLNTASKFNDYSEQKHNYRLATNGTSTDTGNTTTTTTDNTNTTTTDNTNTTTTNTGNPSDDLNQEQTTDEDNENSAAASAVDSTTTDGFTTQGNSVSREEIDDNGNVLQSFDGEITSFQNVVPENYYSVKYTDQSGQEVAVYFSKTNGFSPRYATVIKYPVNIFVTTYDKNQKAYSLYSYSSSDGASFISNTVERKMIDFNTSSDMSNYPKSTNLEDIATFSAIVNQYNEFASLKPITDSVFFDPLNYNFIQYQTSDSGENLIIYNIQGDPTTYKNEPNTQDLSTISPWILVDNKNGLLLYIKPSDLSDVMGVLPIRIFSLKNDLIYYSHAAVILLTQKEGEQIRDDRTNKLQPKPTIYYTEYKDKDVPEGAKYKCLKNGIRYFTFDGEKCLEGELIKEQLQEQGSGNVETYDLSLNIPNNHVSDYYKWMWYWKSKKYEEHNGLTDYSDYILKSSVVPPVCPTCPSCPSCPDKGICTNCGGQGGSGTSDLSGTIIHLDTNGDNIIDSTFSGANRLVSGTLNAAGDATKGVLNTTGDIVKDTASGTLDATKGIVGDIYGAAKGAVGDIYGAAKGAAGDVYGEAKDLGGDAYSEGKRLGGKAYDEGSRLGGKLADEIDRRRHNQLDHTHVNGSIYHAHPMNNDNVNTYVGPSSRRQRVVNPAISNMNYFGALPAKGHDKYIPMTADFSSFGR